MSQGYVPLRRLVLERVARSGGWVARDELADLTTCEPALDDALADLVVDGALTFEAAMGYRMALPELQRRALARLLRDPKKGGVGGFSRCVEVRQVMRQVLVAVAERRAEMADRGGWPEGLGVATYALELPESPDEATAQALAVRMLSSFATSKEFVNVGAGVSDR